MIRTLKHCDMEPILNIWLEGNKEAHDFIAGEVDEDTGEMDLTMTWNKKKLIFFANIRSQILSI